MMMRLDDEGGLQKVEGKNQTMWLMAILPWKSENQTKKSRLWCWQSILYNDSIEPMTW